MPARKKTTSKARVKVKNLKARKNSKGGSHGSANVANKVKLSFLKLK
jgi:hypothetical protein